MANSFANIFENMKIVITGHKNSGFRLKTYNKRTTTK